MNMLQVVCACAVIAVSSAAPTTTNNGNPIVAFSAGLTRSLHVHSDNKIPFDKTFVNVGSAYDVSTGIFTCPKGGVYFFTMHAYSANKDQAMWVELKKGSQLLVSISGYNSHSSAGNSVNVYCNVGEHVYVQGRLNQDFSLFGGQDQVYATFSGHLIGEMPYTQGDSISSGNNLPDFPGWPTSG